jgi:hypothetical protein
MNWKRRGKRQNFSGLAEEIFSKRSHKCFRLNQIVKHNKKLQLKMIEEGLNFIIPLRT